ncbi:hypothetical protein EMCG_03858 [[Emmonsia] crescens]|uniref:Uncharacterized protein n=1 Tax=[Emmonsia] crescens TaxID=73230 RepID=A0A0G2HTX5_9EURO|nr:hypothetical protein EMCG_03858 [Emmonsia crescens UAMH 3008]
MASSIPGHRDRLESIIDFSVQLSLTALQHDQADCRFYSVVEKLQALKELLHQLPIQSMPALKAVTRKTSQPSPATYCAVQRALGGKKMFVRTLDQLSSLQGACLIQDQHHCVIHKYPESLT